MKKKSEYKGQGCYNVIIVISILSLLIFIIYYGINNYQIDNSNPTTIHNVQVVGAYTKQDPRGNSGPDSGDTPQELYFCDLSYSDHGQRTVEPFKDIDQGDKTNSADIYGICQLYDTHNAKGAEAGKFLDAQVIGVRDASVSRFRNILKLTPSHQ